jgi:hypothetical protein
LLTFYAREVKATPCRHRSSRGPSSAIPVRQYRRRQCSAFAAGVASHLEFRWAMYINLAYRWEPSATGLTPLLTISRARMEVSRACDGPTGAAPVLFSPIRWRRWTAASRSTDRCRAAGVRFDNTRFAAAAD